MNFICCECDKKINAKMCFHFNFQCKIQRISQFVEIYLALETEHDISFAEEEIKNEMNRTLHNKMAAHNGIWFIVLK